MLGVNDRATNWAVTSECGRLPTIVNVLTKIIKFWAHLIRTQSPILKAALQTSAALSVEKNSRSWYSFLKRILKWLDMDHILYTCDVQEIDLSVKKVKHILQQKAEANWLLVHNNTKSTERTKLDIFCKVKTNFGLSAQLTLPLCFKERQALSKFRISAHNSPVEILRYVGITDRTQRICPLCNEGVGDEAHYLTECSFEQFSTQRSALFDTVCLNTPQFESMSKSDKMIFLLNNQDTRTLSHVGKFSHQIMEVFKDINKGAR